MRGSATINHNLTVKGWLDAPNVKGPSKGLFITPESLREAYPTPQEGWWGSLRLLLGLQRLGLLELGWQER